MRGVGEVISGLSGAASTDLPCPALRVPAFQSHLRKTHSVVSPEKGGRLR
jgi:hypothetical protein